MISECKGFLLSKAAEWDLPKTGKWKFLFYNNYQPQNSTLNLLWFHDGDEFPRVVTKAFLDPEIPKREFENMVQVYRCIPRWVPTPWHFGLQGKFWMLWMEGVPGLHFSARNSSCQADLSAMIDMLVSMHGSFRKRQGAEPGRYRRVVFEPIQALRGFGTSNSVLEGCARIIARSPAEWIDSLPVVPQHGDLVLTNVLLNRGQYHVIDWDGFGMTDIPFYDLITFLCSLLRLDGELPEHWDPVLVKRIPNLIGSYAKGLGLSSADVSLILPITLASWFYLKWSDGCQAFTARMYKTIQHYFEHQDLWERVFASA